MRDFESKNMTPIQGLIIGLALIWLISPIMLQGVGEGTASSQSQKTFDDITVEQLSKEYDIRAQTITTVYDQAGNQFYRVTFKIIGLNEEFKCSIPEQKAELLNKDSLYVGTITMAYPKEVCEYAVEINESYNSIEDTVLRNSYVRSITDVNFMYADYIETEFDDLEKAKENFVKLYGTPDGSVDSNNNEKNQS